MPPDPDRVSLETLRFQPGNGDVADPDARVLTDEDLERAVEEGSAESGS